MSDRTTLQHAYMTGRNAAGSRATAREFDDDHLVQEIKQADVFHSETPSNFERFQPVGLTSFPIKQEKEQGQQNQQKGNSQQGDWNHNQPKGPAAEVLMSYLNGSRSHPVASMVDDRRVRPYNMSEGEGAHYAPDGSEQMVYFKENGTYVVSLDGKSVKDKQNSKTRMASLRHVNKSMQSHKIDGPIQGKYKHEGESINTEVRCIKDRIEFRAPGDKLVGLYDKSAKRWFFDVDAAGQVTVEMTSTKITAKVGNSKIEIDSGNIFLTSANIDHLQA